jgi:hypothetical protein
LCDARANNCHAEVTSGRIELPAAQPDHDSAADDE